MSLTALRWGPCPGGQLTRGLKPRQSTWTQLSERFLVRRSFRPTVVPGPSPDYPDCRDAPPTGSCAGRELRSIHDGRCAHVVAKAYREMGSVCKPAPSPEDSATRSAAAVLGRLGSQIARSALRLQMPWCKADLDLSRFSWRHDRGANDGPRSGTLGEQTALAAPRDAAAMAVVS
jgi:hypothetical protein